MRKSRKRHLFDRKDYVFNFKKLKLTLLLSILLCSIGWVSSAAQAKLNLNLKNATVKELITQIESQTEYYVLYRDEIFQEGQKISIQAENKSISYVLEELCKQASVTAEIEDNQIILRKAKAVKAEVPSQQDQQKVVSGVVTEVDGFPIPGVSIMVLGTSRGTVTNVNGEFNSRFRE